MAKGEEESGPSAGATSFLRGVTCGGRRACSPFGLGCEGCAGALGVPRAEGPERAGEERGVALELRGREAGLWRPPPALGRLLAAGLGSVVLCSEALLTDFRGPSVAGRGRALGAGRGSPTSVPAARDRRAMAGEGAPGVGPEVSLRAPAPRALLLGASVAFPLATVSSAGIRSPFWPRGPGLVVPLARPGLETGPGLVFLPEGALSPLPDAGALEAGFRELVPALRVGPARGADSGRVAPPMPPARSARGFRPTAPAAPRTRRAAGVTGGGGRGEPGGLGVRSPGGRAAGVRAVAPALALSLLSILHLRLRPPAAPRRVAWGGARAGATRWPPAARRRGEGAAGCGAGGAEPVPPLGQIGRAHV